MDRRSLLLGAGSFATLAACSGGSATPSLSASPAATQSLAQLMTRANVNAVNVAGTIYMPDGTTKRTTQMLLSAACSDMGCQSAFGGEPGGSGTSYIPISVSNVSGVSPDGLTIIGTVTSVPYIMAAPIGADFSMQAGTGPIYALPAVSVKEQWNVGGACAAGVGGTMMSTAGTLAAGLRSGMIGSIGQSFVSASGALVAGTSASAALGFILECVALLSASQLIALCLGVGLGLALIGALISCGLAVAGG